VWSAITSWAIKTTEVAQGHALPDLSQVDAEHWANQDVIKRLNGAFNGPRMGNMVSLYQLPAKLMIADGRREEALSRIIRGIKILKPR